LLPFQKDDLGKQAQQQRFDASRVRLELKNPIGVLRIEKGASTSGFKNQNTL